MASRPLNANWASGLMVTMGLAALCLLSQPLRADDNVSGADSPARTENPADVLSEQQWADVDASVSRALDFLTTRQAADGSFAGPATCQPAVTSLTVMAFLSRGHLPGEGKYGRNINQAVDFVLSTQKESGLFSDSKAEPYLRVQPTPWDDTRAHALYNHGISGVMLAELYGMIGNPQNERIHQAILKALEFTRLHQTTHKQLDRDQGGWRYLFHNNEMDSDLSVTSWQLMFYRSARNAGFDVPKEYIDNAMVFVRSCFDPKRGRFRYSHVPNDYRYTRAMSGAGILALSLSGEHHTEMAKAAASSLLEDSFEYNRPSLYTYDRYHYSVYHCTLAMFQMGGEFWTKFYPEIVETLLEHQRADGSWDEASEDARFGNTYTTAMMIMSLTVVDQMLPIYER